MEETLATPMKNSESRISISPIYETPLENVKHRNMENMKALSAFSNYFTPPSRLTKFISKNPFDVELTNRLHLSVISPTMFNKPTPKSQDSPFSWSIDELARLKPVKIDELITHEVHHNEPELEHKAQEAITRFFQENQIHPSPWNDNKKTVRPLILMTPRRNGDSTKTKKDCSTQTTLSLPINLPRDLEEALKPYLTCSCDEQSDNNTEINTSNSSLRRKLFLNHDESVDDDYDCSEILSPMGTYLSPPHSGMLIHGTPLRKSSLFMQKTRASFIEEELYSPPNISPIHNTSTTVRRKSFKTRGEFVARLDFDGHMSVDLSLADDMAADVKSSGKSSDESCSNERTIEKITNANNQQQQNNENMSIISETSSSSSPSQKNNHENSVLTELKNYSNLKSNITNNITGNPEYSMMTLAQDTGYLTYSASSSSSNFNNYTASSFLNGDYKDKNCWNDQIHQHSGVSSTDNKIRLSDWKENIGSMFSSTLQNHKI